VPLDIQNCIPKFGFGALSEVSTEENEENNEWVEFQGHLYCTSNFDKFSNVKKSISTTHDRKTSLNGPSCEHVVMLVTPEEEEMEEIHLALVCPARKNILMALSVLDTIMQSIYKLSLQIYL
jgi:hypothetical protein